jgi:hypothetical protein
MKARTDGQHPVTKLLGAVWLHEPKLCSLMSDTSACSSSVVKRQPVSSQGATNIILIQRPWFYKIYDLHHLVNTDWRRMTEATSEFWRNSFNMCSKATHFLTIDHPPSVQLPTQCFQLTPYSAMHGSVTLMHGSEEKSVQGFGGKARRKETTRKTKV